MLEKNKNEFIEIYKENITRPGSDKLLNYLISEQSDFFTAPCSTRFHGSYAGGLVQHSINVYNCLKDYSVPKTFTEWNILTKVLL